ncbi:MAG: hypothetical protein VXW65_05590 [Pseudomonadota bacterium]|nr:hypothetical protein [Pseudomonadota bacterium]
MTSMIPFSKMSAEELASIAQTATLLTEREYAEAINYPRATRPRPARPATAPHPVQHAKSFIAGVPVKSPRHARYLADNAMHMERD